MNRLLLSFALSLGLGSTYGQESLEGRARELCAFRLSSQPEKLELAGQASALLPLQERTHTLFKFLEVETGNDCSLALDSAGSEVDSEEDIARELELTRATYGAMSPGTYSQIGALPGDKLAEVVIFIRRPINTPDFRSAADPWAAKQEFTSAHVASVLDRLAAYFPSSQPLPIEASFSILAFLFPAQILQVAYWQEVDWLGLPGEWQLLGPPTWHGTHRFPAAQQIAWGDQSRVGVVELGVFQPMTTLPMVDIVGSTYSSDPGDDAHAASVVSVIANTDTEAAPGSCPGCAISYYQTRANSILAAGATQSIFRAGNADALNLSMYEPANNTTEEHGRYVGPAGRYIDEQAYDFGFTYVAGAGNGANNGSWWEYVPSPANALNVISAGMFWDHNDADWWNDEMADHSWVNPPGIYGDRAKPETITAGSNTLVVDPNSPVGRESWSGTSLSAPMVTGTIGLMNDAYRRNGGMYRLPIEITRSAIAAASLNNVEAVSGTSVSFSFPFIHLGAKQGAGGLDSSAATSIVEKYQMGMISLGAACPPAHSRQALPNARFALTRGQRARVALSFTSLATSIDTPTADLDLLIAQVDPNTGTVVRAAAWSAQVESTLEFVEFGAENTGTYQAFLTTRSCRQAPWYVGYAWFVRP